MTKLIFVSETQRSDQDIRTQMEVNSSQPFAIKEIGTEIDLVTKTKTKFNLVTKSESNISSTSKLEP
jgi:hypothetical protein